MRSAQAPFGTQAIIMKKFLCVMNPLQYTTSLFLSELFVSYQYIMNIL